MTLPDGVQVVRKRNGRTYYYYAPHRGTASAGKRVALGTDPNDPEFWRKLREARGEIDDGPRAGSFRALIAVYRGDEAAGIEPSPEWQWLRPKTRQHYGYYLDRIDAMWGDLQVAALTGADVYVTRDAMAATPVAANHLLSVLTTILKFGVPRGFAKINVARDVERLRVDDEGGAQPWPDDVYRFAIENAPEDLRRAVYLGRHTGQRRSDLVRMGPKHRHQDGLLIEVGKRRDKKHWIPLADDVLAEMDSWGVEDLGLYVTSPTGAPTNGDALNARWNRWRRSEAAKPIRGAVATFHGLRATAVLDRRLDGLSHGDISAQLCMSVQMVQRYSRFADQMALAKAGQARRGGNKAG